MFSRFRLVALLVAAIIVAGLLPLTTSAATASDSEMSIDRAGNYYLKTICTANRAVDRFNAKFYGTKDTSKWETVYYRDYKGNMVKRTRKAAPAAYEATYRAARRLANPPAAWPAGIASRVSRVSENYLDSSDQYDRVQRKSRAKSWDAIIELDRLGVRGARESKRVRAFLNLPSNGHGC